MESLSELIKLKRFAEIPKDNNVKAIIRAYLDKKNLQSHHFKMNKDLKKKYPYPRMAARAKRLLEDCGGNLGDAIHSVMLDDYWL